MYDLFDTLYYWKLYLFEITCHPEVISAILAK
jgi:hypothetical protein